MASSNAGSCGRLWTRSDLEGRQIAVEGPGIGPSSLISDVSVQRDPRRSARVVPIGGEELWRLPHPELFAACDAHWGAGERLASRHCAAAEHRAVSALRSLRQALEALSMRVVGEIDVGKNVVLLSSKTSSAMPTIATQGE